MFSASATTPAWEQNIRAHVALSVFSLKTGSTNSLRAFEAAQFTTSMYSEDAPLPDDVKNQLVSINAVSVQTVQSSTGKYTDTVQGLKDTQPNAEAWKAKILSANQAAIQNFTERINEAGEQAISNIQNLPPAQQNAAASVYSGGMSIVNNVVNQASAAIQDVVAYLKDFLQGLWNKVTEVYNDVKTWCSGALDTLGSLFGFGFFSTFALASQGDTLAAKTAQSFTGFIGWSAAVGMGPARASFDEVLGRLDRDAYITVASQKLSIENIPGQGPCIVGQVEFGAKFADIGQVEFGAKFADTRDSTADLADVWDRILNQPQKPLPTAPLPISQQDWQSIFGGSDKDLAIRRPVTPVSGPKGSTLPRKFGRPPLASNGLLDEPRPVVT